MEEIAKKRILIADEDNMTLVLLRRALTQAGYDVVKEVHDGAQAVKAASELNPDCILMDINMPVMGGIEAIRLIMAERTVPIIIISAYSSSEIVEEAIEAGACGYMVKPIIAEQISPGVKMAFANFARSNKGYG